MTPPDPASDAAQEKLVELVTANPYMRLDPVDLLAAVDGDETDAR